MDLRAVLKRLKEIFDKEKIDFALIGGLAVGSLGYQRFTNDVDLLADESDKEKIKTALLTNGFSIFSENDEFIQFQGPCPVDLQLARRPASKAMLQDAMVLKSIGVKCLRAEDLVGLKIQAYSTNSLREFKEKADIQALFERLGHSLDWNRIKNYADLFDQWEEIQKIKEKSELKSNKTSK